MVKRRPSSRASLWTAVGVASLLGVATLGGVSGAQPSGHAADCAAMNPGIACPDEHMPVPTGTATAIHDSVASGNATALHGSVASGCSEAHEESTASGGTPCVGSAAPSTGVSASAPARAIAAPPAFAG